MEQPRVRQWECPLPHTRCENGVWLRGEAEDFGFVVQSNGLPVVKLRCRNCAYRSPAPPRQLLREWGITEADLVWHRINPRTQPDDYPPCVYSGCTQTPTEYHHFAPYNTFGADANNWPVLPLCRDHHHGWHRAMDGYAWHRKRTA